MNFEERTVDLAGLLTPDDSSPLKRSRAGYLSPSSTTDAMTIVSPIYDVPIANPEPWLDVVVVWKISSGDAHSIAIELQGSVDGITWDDWQAIKCMCCGAREIEDDTIVSQLNTMDATTKFVRFRAVWPAGGDAVELEWIKLHFISPGASPPEMLEAPNAKSSAGIGTLAVARPPVVTRAQWGCPDGDGSRWTPSYGNCTHLTVHHTVTSNSDTDWAARVRAIWNQHAISQNWGDIGYQFLVAGNGVIYQGRSGSLSGDPIGAHVANHNFRNVGVSMLGTFTDVTPTQAAYDSLARILAWKADERGINPLGTSTHNTGGSKANISGHRDWSATACPGNALYPTLGNVRNDVNNLINGTPDPCSGTDNAAYVSEGPPYDGDTVTAGQTFTKTWTMRNTGTAIWRGSCNHKWAWDGGERFNAQEFMDVTSDVGPNGTITWTVTLTAPSTPGLYRGYWRMDRYGTGRFGTRVWVEVNVQAANPCTGTDNAAFVSEGPPYDGNTVTVGQAFTKTWTMRNTGTSTWRGSCNHKWAWDGGERFNAQEYMDVPSDVGPNGTITWTANLTAPSTPGLYRGYWIMDRYGTGRFGSRVWVEVNVQAATGSIRVDINPAEARDAGARWRRTGTSTWRTSGSTENDVPPGNYTVEFNTVSGWSQPANASVTVTSGQTATLSRDYTRHTGSLQVTINPAGARDAGARWRRTGTSTWRTSGSTESGIPTASYTVEYNALDGWNKPADASVNIANGQTATLSGDYVRQTGSLRVNLDPADAATAGAQWRRTGTATWYNHGATESGIPTGNYTVEFQSLSAPWSSPSSLAVSVSHQATSTHTVRYNRPPVLMVQTSLFNHVNAEGSWPVTATDPDGDAVTITLLNGPAGSALQGGFFRHTPSSAQAGSQHVFSFRATDSLGAVTEQQVALQVGSPPVIAPLSNLVVVTGNTITWTVSASDPDNNAKTFTISGAPLGTSMEGSGDSRTISYAAVEGDAGQIFPITFTVTDADGVAVASMNLSVKQTPIIEPVDRRRVMPGTPLTVPLYSRDVDGDQITLSVVDGPAWASILSAAHGGSLQITPPPETAPQTLTMQIRATDVDGSTDTSFELVIVATADELNPFVGQWSAFTSAGDNSSATGQGQPLGVVSTPDKPWTEKLFSSAGILGSTASGAIPVPSVKTRVTGDGRIDPAGDWYVLDGTETTFQLTASPHHILEGVFWDEADLPLNFTFSTNRFSGSHELYAIFRAEVTSQGVPLAWLVSLGLATNESDFELIASSDPTGKGMTVWQDWVAGTDPLDVNSRFQVNTQDSALSVTNNRIALRLTTTPGHRYILWSSASLTSSWSRMPYSWHAHGELTDETAVAHDQEMIIYVPVQQNTDPVYVRPQVMRPSGGEL